jgi:hypothetical protein
VTVHVTVDSRGSAVATLVFIAGVALAVLLLVHVLTSAQAPSVVPDCADGKVLDVMSSDCVLPND